MLKKEYLWALLLGPFLWIHFSDFYVGTFNDDAYYLLAAKSLLQGEYKELAVPEEPDLVSYYPGYPIILALWTKLGGNGFFSIKLFSFLLAFLGVSLAVGLAGRKLSAGRTVLLAVFLGPNPLIAHFSSLAMSEPAFLAFSMAALLLFEKQVTPSQDSPLRSYVLGLLTGFCFLIRPAGLTLFVAILVFLIQQKRLAGAARFIVGFSLMALPWLTRNAILRSSQEGFSLLSALHFGREWLDGMAAAKNPFLSALSIISDNVFYYSRELSLSLLLPLGLWIRGETPWPGLFSFCALAAGLLLFLCLAYQARKNIIAFYGFLYVLLHLIWANQSERYLYPVIPVLLTVILLSLPVNAFKNTVRRAGGLILAVLYLAAAGLSHAQCYRDLKTRGGAGPVYPSQTFQWLKENLDDASVVATPFKGRVYLHTGIKSCQLPNTNDADLFLLKLFDCQATHLLLFTLEMPVAKAGDGRAAEGHQRSMQRKFLRQAGRYRLIYDNESEHTLVFKIIKDKKIFTSAALVWLAGQKAYREQDMAAARSRLRFALEKEAGLTNAAYLLSVILGQSADYDGAVMAIKEALRRFPIYTLGHYRLGELYDSKGQRERARIEYETALKLAQRDQDWELFEICRERLQGLVK